MGLDTTAYVLENLAQDGFREKFADFGFALASGREWENKFCSKWNKTTENLHIPCQLLGEWKHLRFCSLTGIIRTT